MDEVQHEGSHVATADGFWVIDGEYCPACEAIADDGDAATIRYEAAMDD